MAKQLTAILSSNTVQKFGVILTEKNRGKAFSWKTSRPWKHLQLRKWLEQQTKFTKRSVLKKGYPGGAKFDIVRSDSKQIKINLQIVVTIKVTIVIYKR